MSTNTRDSLQIIIERAVEQIAKPPGDLPPPFASESTLRGDLGFDSMDLAHLVAVLELELGCDPFAGTAVADVHTIGDLCRLYREHIGTRQQAADDERKHG